ncbi:MAG: hypothetical protein M9926_04210 [Lentimicrobium sp.]|uniref:hypothetical protein n=1 Tax=Lentimicrobium sp. TaxID=2034841 RepID=UPI0025F233CD|nr:hypothetical protein [Lentimicrobium sp.]MCO5255943.1 hypothetical protein [Lentimicrobium sp.]
MMVRMKTGLTSKFTAAGLFTVITPVEGLDGECAAGVSGRDAVSQGLSLIGVRGTSWCLQRFLRERFH